MLTTRQIKSLISKLGLNAKEYTVSKNFFSCEIADLKRNKKEVNLIKNEIIKLGHSTLTKIIGWGGLMVNIDEYTHYGHEVDYSDTASVWHY